MRMAAVREPLPGMKHLPARTVALLSALVALLLMTSGTSHAVNRYTIIADAPKPAVCNNSGTIPAGTWLQNKPCGYFVGIARAGTSFDVHETTPSNYHFGRNYGNNDFCAWIPPGALGSSPTQTGVAASCSTTTRDNESHRRTFGYDFNAAAHAATDGTAVTVDTGCTAYYDYFTSSDFASGALHDSTGGHPQSQVFYRYTANGGGAVAVRDTALGWVFLSAGCVTDWRGLVFANDDD